MAVASPCISICIIDPASGFCKGCRRTTDEVASWPYLSDEEKQHVLDRLPQRKKDLSKKPPVI